MSIQICLGWLHWNPSRELFSIPYFDHPVAIYGVLFATGFILAYFILWWMFTQKLSQSNTLYEHDIASWPALVRTVAQANEHPDHPLYPLYQRLDRKLKQEIGTLQPGQELHANQKKALLQALNAALHDPHLHLSKKKLESLDPKAFALSKNTALMLTDKLTWFIVLGTLIGARLGHVFFYEWPVYQNDLGRIFKVWEGGLASHGGVLGILIAIYLYSRWVLKKFPEFSLISLLDCIVVPSGLVACFIRIGNFFNQEIMGPPTTMPWGIIFEDPWDGGPIVPRHPTQLYEAIVYLSIFCLLLFLWQRKKGVLRPGYLSGLLFVLLFTSRFFIEFIKLPQSMMIDESIIQMGQYLSLPFILLGCLLLYYGSSIDRQIRFRAKTTQS